ncbi:hypothetical protein [Bacteroides sp.]|uniref:hypothetical protein n=1 Tax=Bacteroides sp. TaxID=29523 RepID=UPI0026244275|nr:hypothetical protein [Bacteroides sp.]MDD3039643.1 hypothetical protein [Bacteroides sp.]
MRTFRLLGMALVAVMMCVNFVACSDDEEGDDTPAKNDDGIITNQKKLIEIKETYDDETNTLIFSYDNKGRVISAVEKDSENSGSETTNFTWGNNSIIATEDNRSIIYTLNGGLVRTSQGDGYSTSYTYNTSNNLSIIKEISSHSSNESYTNTLTWANNKITKYSTEGGSEYQYTYSGKTCKGWFPCLDNEVWDNLDVVFYAHPELAGMRNSQLPDQIYSKYIDKGEYYDDYYQEICKYETTYEETIKFTYTLNSEGYVESCTVVDKDVEIRSRSFEDKNGDGVIGEDERNVSSTNTETYTTVYTCKWE